MTPKRIFNIAYYLNNTIFAFLFIELISTGVFLLIHLLKTPGENNWGVSLRTNVYNVISITITKLLIAFALYQSFVALNNLKRGRSTEADWRKYFFRSGILFCIASITNLLDIIPPPNPRLPDKLLYFYTSDEMNIALNSSSILILAIGVLFFFISISKFNQDISA